jgi:hypothetical protein
MGIVFGIPCFITATVFCYMAILIVRDTLKEKPPATGRELLFVYFFATMFAFWAVAMTLFGSWLIFTY